MKQYTIWLFSLLFCIYGCQKTEETITNISLPTSYQFDNVNFSGQTTRIKMLTEIATELEKGKSQVVNFNQLLNMYSNFGNPFTDAALNTSGKQLRDKTFVADTAFFISLFKAVADNSNSFATPTNANGIAGIATSETDPTKKYLVDSNGVEYAQIIQKGLMGAIFYYRIAEEYTTKAKLNAADNNTVIPGEGTAMQHYWDEAFGYFGVPVSFRAAKYDSFNVASLLKFYGTYVGKGRTIGTIENTLNAFIKGRDAINRKDYTTRDAAAVDVRKNLELINVCSCISYLNQAKTGISNYAVKCHALSEAYGFFISLRYNSEKVINQTDYNTIDNYFKRNGKLSMAHLSVSAINSMIDKISMLYGLDAVKASL